MIFKVLGTVLFAGMFASGIGFLIAPMMVLSILLSTAHGVRLFWPWIIAAIAYGLILGLVIKLAKEPGVQHLLLVAGTFVPAIWMTHGRPSDEWMTWSLGALIAALSFSSGAAACKSELLQKWGIVIAAQMLWLAPLTLAMYEFHVGQPNIMTIITFLTGGIATFFAADQSGL